MNCQVLAEKRHQPTSKSTLTLNDPYVALHFPTPSAPIIEDAKSESLTSEKEQEQPIFPFILAINQMSVPFVYFLYALEDLFPFKRFLKDLHEFLNEKVVEHVEEERVRQGEEGKEGVVGILSDIAKRRKFGVSLQVMKVLLGKI